MLRFLKLVLLGLILVAVIILGLANRGPVTLHLLPEGAQSILQLSVEVPMFVVILGSILCGLAIGYILEWLREHKHRRLAAQKKREASQLSREVETLKKKHMTPEEEVLAILDKKPGHA